MKKNDRPKYSKKYLISRLCKYLFKHKLMLLTAFLLMVSSNVIALIGPKLSGKAIDAISLESGVEFNTVFYYCGLMAVVYLVSSVLSYALSFIMATISKNVAFAMRKDVFEHLSKLPVSFYDRHQTGDIISRISYDIDTINASLTNDVLQVGVSAITVMGSFIMMCTINTTLLCIFLVTVPVAIWFTKYKTKKVHPLFKKRSKALGSLNGYAEEMMSGLRTIKAYGTEDATLKKFDEFNKAAVDAYYNADYNACVVGPCVNFINNISLSFISVLGAFLFILQRITLGDISSFILYSRKFSGPINEAANIVSELQSAFAAADRVFGLLDEPCETVDKSNAISLGQVKGDVKLENIEFGYDKSKKIIKNLNLDVSKGKVVAIVGPTGAGKTTIINLLMRFYDPDSGTIAIDGTENTDITRNSLRQSFTMVLQDTWLFSGTVAENIAYGKTGATLEDIKEVARKVKIDKFIEALPCGYDTLLTDDGVSISKGQKQLITIARAMLNESHMLILDEATSNVDSRTEIDISNAMTALMKDKTCFIIAHRLSTIKNADVILVVNNGEIVETGTHSELLKNKDGVYSAMYNSQFS